MNSDDLQECFAGRKLYGDDFTAEQMAEWYRDETEAYASMPYEDARTATYVYHAWNRWWGYRFLPRDRVFESALGFGSAFGEEFLPVIGRIRSLTILEPSESFVRSEVHGVSVRYVKPAVSGDLAFPDGAFDLVTCLGVLHHVCNVSHVLGEIARCLRPGGFVLVREPIMSMGDWTKPRRWLTKRERGIPDLLFRGMIGRAGLRVVHAGYCQFRPIPKLCDLLGVHAFNWMWITWLDAAICRLLSFNTTYHRTTFLQKFGPQSVYYVLTK